MVTHAEMEILDTLWKTEKALTSREIIEKCEDLSWKPSYIHICLCSLLKKELIRIESFKKNTKNYSRTFKPTLTREDYFISMIKSDAKVDRRVLLELLIEEENDLDMINDWIDAVNKRKAVLE